MKPELSPIAVNIPEVTQRPLQLMINNKIKLI